MNNRRVENCAEQQSVNRSTPIFLLSSKRERDSASFASDEGSRIQVRESLLTISILTTTIIVYRFCSLCTVIIVIHPKKSHQFVIQTVQSVAVISLVARFSGVVYFISDVESTRQTVHQTAQGESRIIPRASSPLCRAVSSVPTPNRSEIWTRRVVFRAVVVDLASS